MDTLDKAAFFQREAAKSAGYARDWQRRADMMTEQAGRDICLGTASRFQHYAAQDYQLARRLMGVENA